MEQNLYVFSVGNDLCAPVAVCSVRMDQGVHGAPLLENLLAAKDKDAAAVIAKAEAAMTALGAPRIFTVSHPKSTEERALFLSLGYSEMILFEKKFAR